MKRKEPGIEELFGRFDEMVENCWEYATRAKEEGRPVVGIMCEYAPRELIMAAGAVPVCLCGGSAETALAAEGDLPVNLCPLVKSTYGYHLEKSNPFLEMADLVVAETTCDAKKKMFELMADRGRPLHVLELPQKYGDAGALERWRNQVSGLREELGSRFGVSIGPGEMRRAIRVMNRERRARRALARLMRAGNPPLTGRRLLDLKSIISGIPGDLDALEGIRRALEGGASSGYAPSPGRRARVLLTGVPLVHGAERVADLIESRGGLIVCAENCTGLKPILEDVDENAADPLAAIAEKYYRLPCSVMTPNPRRFEQLGEMIADYRPDCIVELAWVNCLTYDVESYFTRRLAAEKGLPWLLVRTDYSDSDSAQLETRLEALFELALSGRSS